jgi:D-alanyl-D-alanine carboxypeptidase
MRLFAFVFMSALASAGLAHADPVDDIVRAEMERTHTPGVGLVVVRDGKIIREQGYGMANVEHDVAVRPETIFQSGSVGKQFTAALVMLLVEDGKLKLDDPVSRHLAKTPKAWKNITIRHLLTHTSGLADPYDKVDLRKDYTDEQMIALEATIPMLFQPGEKWSYSNMGYHLLGFICNKAGAKFYGDQLRERIFAPLGMGTRIISESDIVPHRAAGYEWKGGQLKNQDWVAPRINTTADGSLYLTARDLALWDLALYDDKPFNARFKAAMWEPVKLNNGTTHPYGFGWQLDPVNGHRRISHGGAWQGFRTQISRFVDDRLSIIVLTNLGTGQPDKIASRIAAHYVPALTVVPAKPIEDSEPEMAPRVRAIVADFARGVLPPRMVPALAASFKPEIKDISAGLSGMGALVKVELMERSVKGETRSYRYRMQYENETWNLLLAIDKGGRIAELAFR